MTCGVEFADDVDEEEGDDADAVIDLDDVGDSLVLATAVAASSTFAMLGAAVSP